MKSGKIGEIQRRKSEKQNRRRCAITVLEGLRERFTRVTVLAPICCEKSTKREISGQTLGAWYGSFVLLPAYDKTKGPSVLPRGFGSNSHLPRSANATKASANDKTLNPSVRSIIKRAQKEEVL